MGHHLSSVLEGVFRRRELGLLIQKLEVAQLAQGLFFF